MQTSPLNANDERAPIVAICGCYGVGKTTIVAAIATAIRTAANTAADRPAYVPPFVLKNEYGPFEIDQRRLEGLAEVVTATGGCLCHDAIERLIDELKAIVTKRFQYPLRFLEMTGIGDPMDIRKIIHRHAELKRFFRLTHVITVVDAANFHWQVNEPSFLPQVVAGNSIVISKGSLVAPNVLDDITRHLRSVNPLATVLGWTEGAPLPGEILTGSSATQPIFADDHYAHDHGHSDHDHHHHDHDPAVGIIVEGEMDASRLGLWMLRLPKGVHRVKGDVVIAGRPERVVLDYTPADPRHVSGAPWAPGESRVTRLAFLGRGLPALKDSLTDSLKQCLV